MSTTATATTAAPALTEEDVQAIVDFMAENVEVAAFVEGDSKGVRFYTASSRHMPLLEKGTTRYAEAVLVGSLRQQGRTMNAVVEATGFSKPKCRRLLNEMLLLAEVEEAQALAAAGEAAPVAA